MNITTITIKIMTLLFKQKAKQTMTANEIILTINKIISEYVDNKFSSLPDRDNYHYLRGFIEGEGVQEPIGKDDYPDSFNNINEIYDKIRELKDNKI